MKGNSEPTLTTLAVFNSYASSYQWRSRYFGHIIIEQIETHVDLTPKIKMDVGKQLRQRSLVLSPMYMDTKFSV